MLGADGGGELDGEGARDEGAEVAALGDEPGVVEHVGHEDLVGAGDDLGADAGFCWGGGEAEPGD